MLLALPMLNDSGGLTVNVVTPVDTTPESMLPVVVVGILLLAPIRCLHLDKLHSGFMVAATKSVDPPRMSHLHYINLVLISGSADTMAVVSSLGPLRLANQSCSSA